MVYVILRRFDTAERDIIIRAPLLDDVGCPFDRIGPYQILF